MQGSKAQLRKIDRQVLPLFIDLLKSEYDCVLKDYVQDTKYQEVCKYLQRSIAYLQGVHDRKISLDIKKEVDTPTSSF